MKRYMADVLTAVFFLVLAALSIYVALEYPSPLNWMVVIHNMMLVGVYLEREPEKVSDRVGLWLGLCAAFLPIPLMPITPSGALLWVGMAGYTLVLVSLGTLGPRFGIAPAARGLVAIGVYRLVRHPMYLGELLLRGVLTIANPAQGLVPLAILILLQVLRILREEKIIAGYDAYKRLVRWRLIPFVW